MALDEYLKRLKKTAKDKKSVIFPNLVHELDKGFISDYGKMVIENHDFKYIFLDEEAVDARFFPNTYKNNVASNFTSDTNFYSLRSEWWISNFINKNSKSKNKVNLYRDIDPKSLSKDNLIKKINQNIAKKRVGITKDRLLQGMWVTSLEEIETLNGLIEEIILKLGLDHHCNGEKKYLFGLIFKIKNILYKPNVTNGASHLAYCASPEASSSNVSKTVHLGSPSRGCNEFIIPFEYFKKGLIEVTNIFKYEIDQQILFDQPNLVNYILDDLQFAPNNDYQVFNHTI